MKMLSAVFEDTVAQKSFLFEEPVAEVVARSLDDVVPAFQKLESYRQQGFYLAGSVSYEAGFAFFPKTDPAPQSSALPLLHFGVFKEKLLVP